MAYVSGFKHDVFISYAQVAEPDWVKAFLGELQKHLDRELHQSGASSIFWDRQDLEGDSPLTAEITQSLGSTATLVIVLSHAYLDRPWCRKELKTFLNQVGVGSRRAFLVHLEDVPLDMRPQEISALNVLGYKFHEPHPHSEKPGISRPLPIQDDGPFDARIRELAKNLRERLQELKAHPPATQITGLGAIRPRLVGAQVFVADGVEGPRVKDLQESRSQLRSWLAEQQVEIWPKSPGSPGGPYERFIDPSQREACANHVEGLLRQASLCIQLLGASCDEDGYESWLCDRAKAAGKSPGKDLLLWRPQSLKASSIKSDAHRALVFSPELQVIACDLTEFQDLVAKQVEDLGRQRDAQVRLQGRATDVLVDDARGPRHSVLVDGAPEDRQLIEKLRMALRAVGIEYEPAQDVLDFDEMARSGAFDGVAFTFGRCSDEWVNQRLKATRPFRLAARPGQRPRVGVYRERSERELTGTKGIDIIVDGVQESLSDFVAKLKEVAR